ncbi:MAG: cobyrinate a,c-diamide synthase [Desulfoferrobacter sp.]
MNKSPKKYALVIAGTQSGCGKTTLSLALMAALKARGLEVQPFKIGPDFIDSGLHTQISGRESRNLDGWMLSRNYNLNLFQNLLCKADVAIVEGVMGLYDGYDGIDESGSSAEMAKWLDLPVVLVVDARSMARSAAALVYGFKNFDSNLRFAGVIFNRIAGEGHLTYLKQAMSVNLPDIDVLGGIPREEAIAIPERHLGLVTADEFKLNRVQQDKLVGLVERYLDIDLLLPKVQFVSPFSAGERALSELSSAPTIAVARDAAFCFYYPDNFEMLRQAGAKIHYFSPLAGETLPPETAGLYLGGGYPELFAGQLSSQSRFFQDIHSAVERGMPVYAECGGLMTLSRFIETGDGKSYAMAGLLPFGTRMLGRRKALGYTEVELCRSCLLGEPGLRIRGHEFHYSEIVQFEEGEGLNYAYELHKRKQGETRLEGYMHQSVLASYIHLHWGSAPQAASNFVRRCEEYKGRS